MQFGTRGAVDQALWLKVKARTIIRATSGVFYKPDSAIAPPTPEKIIETKASAFGRKIGMHAHETATKLGLVTEESKKYVYAITGRSSSFVLRECGERVHLLGTSARKAELPKSTVGTAILALWHCGRKNFSKEKIAQVVSTLNEQDQHEFFNAARNNMPSWLGHLVRIVSIPQRKMAGSILAH